MAEADKITNDPRTEINLKQAFVNADRIVMKKYLTDLDKCNIFEPSYKISKIKVGDNVEFFKLCPVFLSEYKYINSEINLANK